MIFGAARSRRPAGSPRRERRRPAFTPDDLPPKLIPSLRALISTAASLAHTRLALASIELEEEMQRLIMAAILGVVAVIFALLGLVVGTFTVVAAVAPENRVWVMLAITLVYLAIAIIAVMRVKSIFANRPPIFAATLAELEKDKETLSQMNRAHQQAEDARERERAAGETGFAPVRPEPPPTAGGTI